MDIFNAAARKELLIEHLDAETHLEKPPSSLPLRVLPFRQLWQGTIQKGESGGRDDIRTGGPKHSAFQEAPHATLIVELAYPAILHLP